MRHALVAESAKRELNDKEANLRKECAELEDKISEMELKEKEIVKQDQEDRDTWAEEHKKFKFEKSELIY